MSRPLRIEYPGACYHVMNRGRRSESIFLDKHDYLMFIDLLIEISEMSDNHKRYNWPHNPLNILFNSTLTFLIRRCAIQSGLKI